jgi:hypothetical protein
MKTTIVSWLLRLYPKAWSAEYGAELADMLRARPLTVRVCSDIVLSALRQHARASQVASWVGVGLMLVTIGALASNIVEPPTHIWSPGLPRRAQPSFAEYIALLQRPLHSEFYVLVLVAIGFWTALRGKTSPGRAAIRVSMIASVPLVLVGLLMVSGVLGYSELNPGQSSTTLDERGILYTFYKGFQQIPGPAPLVMLLSPLLRLPGAWMWGSIGGWLGRKFADWRRPVSV